jgi:hypothetical protein
MWSGPWGEPGSRHSWTQRSPRWRSGLSAGPETGARPAGQVTRGLVWRHGDPAPRPCSRRGMPVAIRARRPQRPPHRAAGARDRRAAPSSAPRPQTASAMPPGYCPPRAAGCLGDTNAAETRPCARSGPTRWVQRRLRRRVRAAVAAGLALGWRPDTPPRHPIETAIVDAPALTQGALGHRCGAPPGRRASRRPGPSPRPRPPGLAALAGRVVATAPRSHRWHTSPTGAAVAVRSNPAWARRPAHCRRWGR